MSATLKRLLAILAFAGIPLLYFACLPVSYSFDGTVFSQMLRYALLKHDWLDVVQIHHLAYFPLNYLVYRVLAAVFHYRVLEFFHLQMFSLFFGTATLLLVERMLRRLGLDLQLRLIGVATVAFSYAFWLYTVDAEIHIPGVFFVAAGLYLIVFKEARKYSLIWAALCFALAAGFHLTNALIIGSVFFFFLRQGTPWRRHLHFYSAYLAFMLLLYGGYAFMARKPVVRVVYNTFFGADAYTGYRIHFINSPSLATIASSCASLKNALVAEAGIWAWLLFVCFAFFLALAVPRAETPDKRTFKWLMLLWAVPYFLFFTLCYPSGIEFKIHVLVPLSLTATISLSRLKPPMAHGAGALLAVGLLWLNLSAGILPQTEIANNGNYQVALSIRRSTPANALILITGSFDGYGYGKIYIPYFAGREVLILDWSLGKGHSLAEIQAALLQRMKSGQPVYTLAEIAVPGKALRALLDFHKVRKDEFALFSRAVRYVPVAALPGAGLLYRLELPAP